LDNKQPQNGEKGTLVKVGNETNIAIVRNLAIDFVGAYMVLTSMAQAVALPTCNIKVPGSNPG
jgi:hypothetical protein